jgi:hypothetical protein
VLPESGDILKVFWIHKQYADALKKWLYIKRSKPLTFLENILLNILLSLGLPFLIKGGLDGNFALSLLSSGIAWKLNIGFNDPLVNIAVRILPITLN